MKRVAGIVLLTAIATALLINGYLVCIHHSPKDVSMAKSLVNKIEYMR
jgi:hypothetical protein